MEGSHLGDHRPPDLTTAHSLGSSDQPSLAEEDIRDQDLSDDEDLTPDQPSFVGLFKPQFLSLLHKAKITTRLAPSRPASTMPGEGVVPSVPLFEEPIVKAEEIPGPKLFRDVLSKHWTSPASGPNPNPLDQRLCNMALELAKL